MSEQITEITPGTPNGPRLYVTSSGEPIGTHEPAKVTVAKRRDIFAKLRHWLRERILAYKERLLWRLYVPAHPFVDGYLRQSEGRAYLALLQLQDWCAEHPCSPELKYATETFYNSLKDHAEKNQSVAPGA